MLTKHLGIADYDLRNSRIVPDRLTSKAHRHYVEYAERMLDIYRSGIGRTRRELHRLVHAVFADEADCPTRRIDAFCKLLDDRSRYDRGSRGEAARLRQSVFRMAAARHPLVRQSDRLFENEEAAVKAEIAASLGKPWGQIDRELFADIMEFHTLAEFTGYPDGRALLARYNVAQVQVALFEAVSMTVWATEDLKTVLRYAKLAGLMHTIARTPSGGYCLRFDGPASLLRETRRYGIGMARFLPALIACRGWKMHAVIRTGRRGWNLSLDLSGDDGLNSHVPPPEQFDSQLEEDFARKWGAERRDGWELNREGEVLSQGQKVFVPDFVFRHEDGQTVLLEIVGFWTPEYLQEKVKTLRLFEDHPILLAIGKPGRQILPETPPGTIFFKSVLRVKDVLARLQELRGTANA